MRLLALQAESTANDWWSRLLGIDRVNLAEGEWHLDWKHALPLWILVLVVLPLLGTAVWAIYKRERRDVAIGPKVLLTTLRSLIVLLVLLLLMGPVLTVEIVKHRKSFLVVMLDDSLSMLKHDPPADPADKLTLARVTGVADEQAGTLTPEQEKEIRELSRAEILGRLLRHPKLNLLGQLEQKLNVAYFVFSKGTRQAKDREEFLSSVPSGTETAVGESIRQAIGRLRGQNIVGIVVFSDGRNNSGTDPVSIVKDLYVPVYTVPAGIKSTPRDIELAELEALGAVLANDPLRIQFKIRSFGFEGRAFDLPLHVYKIRDEIKEIPTDPKELEKLISESKKDAEKRVVLKGNGERQEESFHFSHDTPGNYLLLLKIDPQEGENNPANNYLVHRVRVADDKIRVLFVEHPARYEYRYLKNALIRDEKILVHCLLTSADVGFPQEHSQRSDDPRFKEPLREFPSSLDKLLEYDVLILGDVDIGKIGGTPTAEMIQKFVGEFGGGLLIVSGELNNPRTFQGTPLSSLLPVVPEESRLVIDPDYVYEREFGYRLTNSGLIHEIVKNCWRDFSGSPERILEHWEDRDQKGDGLKKIYWFTPVRAVKPHALTLVEIAGVAGTEKNPPLFVVMQYGLGRIFWSATDDTWRWRYKRGDAPYFYPFWRQAMYWSRQGKLLGAVRYRLDVVKDRYQQNETVQINANAYDQNYNPLKDDTLKVYVEPPEGKRIEVLLGKDKTREGYYEGTFSPSILGRYKAWVGDEDEATRVYDRFEVFIPNREEANPALDPDALLHVADASHQAKPGTSQFYPLDRIQELPNDVMTNKMELTETKEDELWDSPLAYLLFALLITSEWILRKIFRML